MSRVLLKKVAELTPAYRAAAAAAVQVSENSYSPYSRFCVGAARVHPDGTLTVGTNWENCTYQATCAERCAIVTANAQGKRAAVAVAVYGKVKDAPFNANELDLVSPCGLCRQQLYEVAQLSGQDLDVIMVAKGQKFAAVVRLSELLPRAFGPTDAGLDISSYTVGNAAQAEGAVAAPAQPAPTAAKKEAAPKPAAGTKSRK
jgi:cytidine deaminase